MISRSWIFRFVRSFVKPEHRDDIEGDLNEIYYSSGEIDKKRKWTKTKEFLSLVRPELLYNPFRVSFKINNNMISHYWKIALRGFMKNKITSSISLIGLSLGLACALMGYLYIDYQLAFDQFHQKKGRLYRMISGNIGTPDSWVKIAAPFLSEVKDVTPEIESFTRFDQISHADKVIVEVGEEKFSEGYFMMADPNFFSVFSFPLLTGDANSVLVDPGSVVITERIANKIFGTEDPLGKIIRVDNDHEFIVSGVAQDPPEQSHMNFDYIVSFENLSKFFGENAPYSWGARNYYGYVLLHDGADKDQAIEKIRDFRHSTENYSFSFDEFDLQPITNIHFEHNRGDLMPSVDPRYLWIFGSISIFVLIVALANYINLTIALSLKRSKEFGVRKALGAARTGLISQFVSETFINMIVGAVIAIGWVQLSVPYLNSLLNSKMNISFRDPGLWIAAASIVAVTAILASVYLSLVIAKLNPVAILKGSIKTGRGFGLQKGLLTIQFFFSIMLIVNSLIISSQLDFLRTKDIGLNPEGVVNVPLYTRLNPDQLQGLKTEIGRINSVINTTASTFVPGEPNWHQTVVWDGQTPEQEEDSYMYIMAVDRDFIRTLDLQLVYGNLEDIENPPPDQIKYLINESGLKFIGWDSPEGKQISPFGPSMKADIVGVVKDFNFRSLHERMDPLLIPISNRFFHRQFSIRVKTDKLTTTLEEIEKTYKKVTGSPFEFYFMSDKIEGLYRTEKEAGSLVSISTFFALLLATIGLFAIVSFSIEERTKEIAIRKILGISIREMLTLFSKRYLYLLGFAALLAWPVSWFAMDAWLKNFAYRIELTPFPFIAAGVITLGIIMGVIGFKTMSTRKIDPASALKYE